MKKAFALIVWLVAMIFIAIPIWLYIPGGFVVDFIVDIAVSGLVLWSVLRLFRVKL